MRMESTLSKSIKLALISAVGVTGMVGFGAVAQEQEAEEVERIEVTGSRIKRIGDLSPTPVTVVTGAQMADMGITNVADILNQLPSSTVGLSPETSNNFIFANGLNTTNLRGLGADRTLVLVNGRRFVAGSNGNSAVDLNTIPTAIVERIEVVTGGASAVYGSDAIAGVVNIITRKDIQGAEVDLSYIQPEQSGGEEMQASFTFGGDYLDGKLSSVFNVTYAEQKQLKATDRDFLSNPVGSIHNPDNVDGEDGLPARIQYEGRKPLSWINEAGTFFTSEGQFTFDENGNLKPFDYGEGLIPGPDYANNNGNYCGPSCEGYDPTNYSFIRTPLERWVLTFNNDYEINDDHKIVSEITYAKYDTHGESSPVFHTYDPANTVKADNAFLTAETKALLDRTGADEFTFYRIDTEFGNRKYEQERETLRFMLGLEGAINDNWEYSVYAQKGALEETTLWTGEIWDQRYHQAKDAIVDANGNIVCRDEAARAAGCVPLNLFGVNQASQEAIDWVQTSAGRSADTDQFSAGAFLSGSVYELPAGDLGVAFSIEYRKEEASTTPDQALIDGTIFGNTAVPSDGDYDVTEAAIEMSIPVFDGMFLADDLTFDLAYRWMDYSTAGKEDAWKLGVSWAPIADLRFRANKSKSVRAPNIGELFDPGGQTFASITDVCDVANIDQGPNENRKKNCTAAGYGNGWNPTDDWYQGSRPGSISGNPDLDAETSRDYTIGFVYTPSFIEDFSVTMDYWSFEITDAINYISVNTAVRYCYDSESLDNIYCGLFTRDSVTGNIIDFVERPVNSASFDVKGLDIETDYRFSLDSLGDFRIHLIATYLEKWEYNPTGFEADLQKDVGEYTDPRWKARFTVSWTYDELTIDALANYRHSAVASNDWQPENNNYNDIPSHTTWDFTGTYDVNQDWTLRFGVLNAFDKAPPRNPYVYDGDGLYDTQGRAFFLGTNYRF
ncbi:TonB-dependent receptor [Ferrimonas aestuarii]|uniref:TonB-dependent receptor n=1 Tax=Ferrimonas aestuarii TaxID=2569539 RepID=A0A4U1BP17_9GAMM|nr:TonB-dependent receptor [Ferrimonas aestuarii]TKB54196.1 TonB-dependent receptor [Ferrimonas aestuarii]